LCRRGIRVMADNAQVADNGPKQCRTQEATDISSNGGDRESTQTLLLWDVRPYSFVDRYRRFGRIHCLCPQNRRVHSAGKMEEGGRNRGYERNINGNHWQSNSYLLTALPCICICICFGQRVSSTLFPTVSTEQLVPICQITQLQNPVNRNIQSPPLGIFLNKVRRGRN